MDDNLAVECPMSWEEVRNAQLSEMLKLTPEQRLQLLEDMIEFSQSVKVKGKA